MKHPFVLLMICCLFVFSCNEEKPPIPQDKMAEILTELHLAESFAQILPVDQGGYMTKNYDTMMVLYSNIYSKYKLDTADFKTAVRWYEAHPKMFDQVYEQVLESLSLKKESIKDSVVETADDSQELSPMRSRTVIPDTL